MIITRRIIKKFTYITSNLYQQQNERKPALFFTGTKGTTKEITTGFFPITGIDGKIVEWNGRWSREGEI